MKEKNATKIGFIFLILILLTGCGNVQEQQLSTEEEQGLNISSFSNEKEMIKMEEWGKILYEYSLKKDSAIYSKGRSAVVTVNQWEQYVKYYMLAGETEEDAKNLATKEAEEYEALYQEAVANGYGISEEELNNYLEELKQTIQEAENKGMVTIIMDAFPSEQAYWDYQRTVYQKQIPIQNYIQAEQEVYLKEQNDGMDWNIYFEKWKANLRQKQKFQKIK